MELNVQTAYSTYEAVYLHKKLLSKFITFANLLKKEARVLKVDVGTKISEIVNISQYGEGGIFVGGGLMQSRRAHDNEIIEKTINFIALANMPRYKEGNCSKCRICVDRCPSGLEVYKISELVDADKLDQTYLA